MKQITEQCHTYKCGKHGKAGEPLDKSIHCAKCWKAARDKDLAKSLNRSVLFDLPPKPVLKSANISYRLARKTLCMFIGDKAVAECGCPDRHCGMGLGIVRHAEQCQTCNKYAVKRDNALPPSELIFVKLKDHFNASIIEFDGKRLMASRYHSTIHISEMNADWQPMWTRYLHLHHEKSANGAEDPRWYVSGGRLHVRFTGVSLDKEGKTIVSVMDARLNDNLNAEKIWEPLYAKRKASEKNWSPFEWNGEQFSVYSAWQPYIVLKHDGETASHYATHQWSPKFTGDVMRGGAAPILVGDEFWHFFHGMRVDPDGNDYTLGLYTFDAKPPFAPKRIIRTPLLYDLSPSPRPRGENPAIYPCGAIRQGDQFLISYGLHNSSVEIVKYEHSHLERLLVPA